MKIAIIVPFYQEKQGILTRCLSSIFQQTLDAAHQVRIVIVDDESPIDPIEDIIAAGEPPANMRIEVLHRENGGPGAARNTGLDAVMGRTDVIALIDSDDTWRPDHLKRAVRALASGFDIYFSDHDRGSEQSRYLQGTDLFNAIQSQDFESSRFIRLNGNMVALEANDAAEFFALEYLAHTSSIAYKARKLGEIRMLEDLRSAGEDHLFFVDLVLASRKICMSLDSEVVLGTGVNIYFSAFDWGSERDLHRRTYNLASLKVVRDRAHWSRATRSGLTRRLRLTRLTLGQLLVRQIFTGPSTLPRVVRFVWRFDPLAVVAAPMNAFLFSVAHAIQGPRFIASLK